MYMTNAGSWSTASIIENRGGWGSEMVIDVNDDVFVPNFDSYGTSFGDELQLTTVKVRGKDSRLDDLRIPMLPDEPEDELAERNHLGYADPIP